MIASRIAFLRSFVRFRKKLTVIGIIGQTQGVNKAIKPPKKPAKKMNNQEVSAADTVESPNAFNWSITGDQRFGLSVKLSDALGDVIAGVSLAAGSGVFNSLASSATTCVSGCTVVASSLSTSVVELLAARAGSRWILFLSKEKGI